MATRSHAAMRCAVGWERDHRPPSSTTVVSLRSRSAGASRSRVIATVDSANGPAVGARIARSPRGASTTCSTMASRPAERRRPLAPRVSPGSPVAPVQHSMLPPDGSSSTTRPSGKGQRAQPSCASSTPTRLAERLSRSPRSASSTRCSNCARVCRTRHGLPTPAKAGCLLLALARARPPSAVPSCWRNAPSGWSAAAFDRHDHLGRDSLCRACGDWSEQSLPVRSVHAVLR